MTKEVSISDQDYEPVFCPGIDAHGCQASPVEAAPILIHIGCPLENPFRTARGFGIPASVYYKTDTGQEKIESWQLDLPRILATANNTRHEMWFPQSLFLAVNALQPGNRGGTVLLLGEQEAGKSVLATMAVRDDTWQVQSSVSTAGYVYIAPSSGIMHSNGDQHDEGRAEEYLQNLAATVRDDGKLMGPTPARERNIRALFLSESGLPTEAVSRAPLAERSFSKNERVTFPKILKRLVLDPEEGLPDSTAKATPAKRSVNRNNSTVVFYDVAGEQARTAVDGQIVQLAHHFDRCAVVLDIRQLSCFSDRSPRATVNGLRTALNNVRRLSPGTVPHCLVITKLDLLREQAELSAERMLTVEKVKRILSAGTHPKFSAFLRSLQSPMTYEPLSEHSEKEVLLELLRRNSEPSEMVLHDWLKDNDSWPVFFVWTEGLSQRNPNSIGIRRFVQTWCLSPKTAAHPVRGQ